MGDIPVSFCGSEDEKGGKGHSGHQGAHPHLKNPGHLAAGGGEAMGSWNGVGFPLCML